MSLVTYEEHPVLECCRLEFAPEPTRLTFASRNAD
jgi:hypothetical protein